MKIEGNGPNAVDTSGAQRADRTRPGAPSQAGHAHGAGPDRVEVSDQGQLVAGAIKAAHDAPDIRHGLVERARQRLATGELGRDVLQLADRLIDHLIKR